MDNNKQVKKGILKRLKSKTHLEFYSYCYDCKYKFDHAIENDSLLETECINKEHKVKDKKRRVIFFSEVRKELK